MRYVLIGKDGYRTPLVSLNRDRSLFITGMSSTLSPHVYFIYD
jgi:hypothetical protein